MAGKSKIEWTGHTWNPFAGCAVLSPGCTNCYAMKMAARLEAMGQSLYAGLTKPSKAGPVWRGTVRANPDALLAPLKRKTPTTYFVNSMSDLFYEKFSDDLIDRVFAVMALCPQHTFQVLTKRAERMREYFGPGIPRLNIINGHKWSLLGTRVGSKIKHDGKWASPCLPLPNVWLGVSAERQQEADERIPHLLKTPAAIRFVSAEPLLGPIDLQSIEIKVEAGNRVYHDYLHALLGEQTSAATGCITVDNGPSLDWIIVGGESGKDARPMHPDWARSLRDQCEAAGVSFFFKQWGQWAPSAALPDEPQAAIYGEFHGGRDWVASCMCREGDGALFSVGKAKAGRLLDNREHNAFPRGRG